MQRHPPLLFSEEDPSTWRKPLQLVGEGWEADPLVKSIGTERVRIIQLVKFDSPEDKAAYLKTEAKPGEFDDAEDFVSIEAEKLEGGKTHELLTNGWVMVNFASAKNLVQLKKIRGKPANTATIVAEVKQSDEAVTTRVVEITPPSRQPTSEPSAKPVEPPAPPADTGGAQAGYKKETIEEIIARKQAEKTAASPTPETKASVAFKPASGGAPIAEFAVTEEAVAKAEAELVKEMAPAPPKKATIIKHTLPEIDRVLLGCDVCSEDGVLCKDMNKKNYTNHLRGTGATLPNSCPEWRETR